MYLGTHVVKFPTHYFIWRLITVFALFCNVQKKLNPDSTLTSVCLYDPFNYYDPICTYNSKSGCFPLQGSICMLHAPSVSSSLTWSTVIVFHNAYFTYCDITFKALLVCDCDKLALTLCVYIYILYICIYIYIIYIYIHTCIYIQKCRHRKPSNTCWPCSVYMFNSTIQNCYSSFVVNTTVPWLLLSITRTVCGVK